MNMTPCEFEEAVWQKERVRICIRAPRDLLLKPYHRKNRAPAKKTTRWLLENRMYPLVGDHDVFIVDGSGKVVRGNMLIETVRASYRR